MAGFFRKVAGAFVEFPEQATPAHPIGEPSDDVDDVDDLVAQLDALKADHGAPVQDAPPPPPPDGDLLAQTPDAAFAAAGIGDGANSSNRLLKMIAGLAMFPPEQQVAMVRALDAADDNWSESAVLADARARLQALRSHQDAVEREHGKRIAALNDRGRDAQSKGDEAVTEIDRQVTELRELRQEALTETANALAGLDGERRTLDSALERSRAAIGDLSGKLSSLITFFAGQRGGSGGHG